MRSAEFNKRLVCYPVMLACLGLAAGCHCTRTHDSASAHAGAPAPIVSGSESSAATSTTSTEFPRTSDYTTNEVRGDLSIPLYEERVLVGTRSVESGGVRFKKEIVTETVNHPVQIRHETVVIDRQAIPSGESTLEQGGTLSKPFEAGELVIRLHKEEPVVETRVVPSGRIVAQTRTNAEQTTIQRQVRRETIDVVNLGDGSSVTISKNVGSETNSATGAPPPDTERTQGQGNSKPPTKAGEEPYPRR